MKKYLLVVVGFILGIVSTSYAAYKLKAEQVSFDKNNTTLSGDSVQEVLDELVISLNNGKKLLSESITNKGISTASTDSFETMANNIGKIKNKVTKTYVGSGWAGKNNTFNCTSIADYQTLTVDNFALVMTGAYGTGDNDGGKTGAMAYSASTGVLTIAPAVSSNNAPTYNVYCFH